MLEPAKQMPRWMVRWECAFMVAACALGFASIPLMLGHIGLSWDALNHHIYLGWIAEGPRFDRDHLAASYQSLVFPYLYWPAYKLAIAGASGVTAGVVLALLQSLVAPAIWMIARACIPGTGWFDFFMRGVAFFLAFASCVTLSLLDTTSNDLLAAIPLVWAIAYAIEPLTREGTEPVASTSATRSTILSGVLAGIAVAFKFSNGPVAIVLPVLWLWPQGGVASKLRLAAIGSACTLLGFAAVYGYWGWQLWTHYGNPIYPFFDAWFQPLRSAFGIPS